MSIALNKIIALLCGVMMLFGNMVTDTAGSIGGADGPVVIVTEDGSGDSITQEEWDAFWSQFSDEDWGTDWDYGWDSDTEWSDPVEITSGDWTYTLNDNNEAEIFSYTGTDTSVIIPDSLDGYPVTALSGQVIYSAADVTTLTLPDSVTRLPEEIKRAVYTLEAVLVSPEHPTYVSVDGVLYSKDMTSLVYYPASHPGTEYTVPEGVTDITGSAFFSADMLKRVTLPESLVSIGWDAFFYCESLESINLPEGLASIGDDAFGLCAKLRSVTLPAAFSDTDSLPFRYCTGLKEISVSPANTAFAVQDGMLFTADMTTLLLCPIGLEKADVTVPEGVRTLAPYALSGCEMSAVSLPSSLRTIRYNAFAECLNLTSVTLPEGVESLEDSVFFSCVSLTSVQMPDTVTQMDTGCFYMCTSLSDIRLSRGLTELDSFMFDSCDALKEIYIPASVTEMGAFIFTFQWNDEAEPVTILCEEGSYAQQYAIDNACPYTIVNAN